MPIAATLFAVLCLQGSAAPSTSTPDPALPELRQELLAWPDLDPGEVVLGQDEALIELAARHGAATWRALLDDGDGRVRAVALAALYEVDGVRALPEVLARVDDEAAAPGRPTPCSFTVGGAPCPLEPQSVGRFAADLLHASLGRHSVHAGWDRDLGRRSVEGYRRWLERDGDRTDTLLAWQLELDRAGIHTNRPSDAALGRLLVVRERLDALPNPRRAWTVLALAAKPPEWERAGFAPGLRPAFPVEDVVRAARALGAPTLLALLEHRDGLAGTLTGEPGVAEDPDHAIDCGPWSVTYAPFPYPDVVEFVLAHAGELLPREAASELERIAELHFAHVSDVGTPSVDSALWFTARSQLAPERTRELLETGAARFTEDYQGRERWRLIERALEELGPQAYSDAVEWFYAEDARVRGGTPSFFLEDLRSPSRRALLVAVLRDERLADLAPMSLLYLGMAVDSQDVGAPEFGREFWSRLSHPSGLQRYAADRAAARAAWPEQTARLEAGLSELVTRLQLSVEALSGG